MIRIRPRGIVTSFLGAAVAAAVALAPASCVAQDAVRDGAARIPSNGPPPGPGPEEIAARRARALERLESLGAGGVLLVRSGEDLESVLTGFRPDPDFYYLTGLAVPGAALLLDPAGTVDGAKEVLFLEPPNTRRDLWAGTRIGPGEEATRATGIRATRPAEVLETLLPEILAGKSAVYVNAPRTRRGEPLTGDLRRIDAILARGPAADGTPAEGGGPGSPDGDAAAAAAASPASGERPARDSSSRPGSPSGAVKRPSLVTGALRQVKSEAEIALIRHAVDATCESLRRAIASARPGMGEYQLQALIEYTYRDRGCERPAFASIVGSGPNSCVLHYRTNSRTMEAGDLVVMDVGGEYRGYAADVTRTIPVSGRFSPEQRAIYDIVLKAQKAGLQAVAPGRTIRDVHAAAAAVIAEAGYRDRFPHGTSHWVGLDVHDVSGDSTLRPGMVLTVEPGIYLAERALGVRIEDTVLVTDAGCEVLSASAPKEPEEIEALMAAAGGGRAR